jgi:putative PEP-CTERM system histidine kinase
MFNAASHGICAIAFLGVSAATLKSAPECMRRRHFIFAALATALWATLMAASDLGAIPVALLNLSELLRSGAWLYFLLTLWGRLDDSRGATVRRILVTRAFLPIVVVIGLVALPSSLDGTATQGSALSLKALVNIVLPVLGLLLIENLLRISGTTGRWAIKHLCLGLGAVMSFDFFIYSDALVQGSIGEVFITARGLITALIVPLLWISFQRLRTWKRDAEIRLIASPKAAFYTMALVASGSYLLVMAGVAYYIRIVGGKWGAPLQIAFMAAALLIMLVSIASSQLKSHAKIFVLKNFFAYRYDYREEWLHFLQIMSARQPLALGPRLVRAMADLMDSPASALWVLRAQDQCFFSDAAWNLPAPHPPLRADSALAQFFRHSGRVIDLDEYRKSPSRYDAIPLPDWITARPAAWLVVPLVHRGEVLGFVVIDHARAPRRLDWEDRDLLDTTAIQAASYLAEELTAEALRAAHRLEDFNRQFAFVVHDIKNVVGQMSLLLGNAKTHGDNPDFQKDMLETVHNSVGRMRAMLDQLAVQRQPNTPPQVLDLNSALGRIADHWHKIATKLCFAGADMAAFALVDEAKLASALDLLIDNALAVVGPTGTVVLRLGVEANHAVIEVCDDGPGMDAAFIDKDLFRPLASTKASGYGIGAYQTRHLVGEMGGRLEVDSVLGHGTTMRIVLPLTDAPHAIADETQILKARHG